MQEGYPVGPGIVRGLGRWGGVGAPQAAPDHPMMELPMVSQGPRLLVRIAIREVDPLEEPFLVGVSLPCRAKAVGL